jgi:phthalate 4,5-dioxygenase oxygenase subunit
MALSKEENDLITQTGPGTPCGNFMRRYWLPVALVEELPEDGRPVPVRLLGEDLVLFRDGGGRPGLLYRFCSHRAWDLAAGYPEDAGLRCAAHGWLYDVTGQCLEMPLEPPENDFHAEIKHVAYPCAEQAGLVFAYLGPDEPPVIPAYEFLSAPDDHRRGTKYFQECNYLQGNEATLDPLVVPVLRQILNRGAESGNGASAEPDLVVHPEETSSGLLVRTTPKGEAPAASSHARSFLMPSISAMAAAGMDGYTVHWHVPIDDSHHWRYVIAVRRDAPITDEDARRNGAEAVPRYRIERDEVIRVLHERADAEMNFVAYTTALAESQGAIVDRTHESLADADAAIILMRSLIYGGIEDVSEGEDPLLVARSPAEASEIRIETAEITNPSQSRSSHNHPGG